MGPSPRGWPGHAPGLAVPPRLPARCHPCISATLSDDGRVDHSQQIVQARGACVRAHHSRRGCRTRRAAAAWRSPRPAQADQAGRIQARSLWRAVDRDSLREKFYTRGIHQLTLRPGRMCKLQVHLAPSTAKWCPGVSSSGSSRPRSRERPGQARRAHTAPSFIAATCGGPLHGSERNEA